MSRKPKMRRGRPPEVEAAEIQYGRCPRGHPLPNHTNKGDCAPIYCALEKGDKADPKKAEKARRSELARHQETADKHLDKMLPKGDPLFDVARADAIEEKVETVSRMAKAVGRLSARRAFFNVPEGLGGAEAEEWATQRAVSLLPDALAEIEYQLKMGDDSQRRDAARDVLDINGMRKKDGGGNVGATIILNLGGSRLPWQQGAKAEVVEGEVTGEKKPA